MIDFLRLLAYALTSLFRWLNTCSGLPPIRLHDLRHGAATMALAAGVDMKVVQHMLRHASESTAGGTGTGTIVQRV